MLLFYFGGKSKPPSCLRPLNPLNTHTRKHHTEVTLGSSETRVFPQHPSNVAVSVGTEMGETDEGANHKKDT
jgi:hypothetical protein